MKNDLETEVKFYIPEPSAFRNRILSENSVSQGRIFEKNILFDTPDKTLRKKGVLLRLRLAESCILTVKTPPETPDPDFKVLHEIETRIEDCEAAARVFRTLGFTLETPYEKYRETFLLEKVEICLDEMPFGVFAELEGEKKDIRNVAHRLGLDWSLRQTLSYRALFELLARHHGYGFSHITFKAFEGMPADVPAILPRLA